MRNTGSRDPRESREASATSPVSIAVNTFSIRFGSRRIQRASHQKTRSSTTAIAVIDTIRIGHMIGPPFLKLSTKKFLSIQPVAGAGVAATDAPGEAAVVVEAAVAAGAMPEAVEGVTPAMGEMPGAGAAGTAGLVTAGAPGAAGFTGAVFAAVGARAGLAAAGAAGVIAGGWAGAPGRFAGGAPGGGGAWPNELSTSVTEQSDIISGVFIGLREKFFFPARISPTVSRSLSPMR